MRVQRHATAALYPGKDPVLIIQKLDGPQSRSGQVRKISPPQGFDPRTVQPVASRYADWATRPTTWEFLICSDVWEPSPLFRSKKFFFSFLLSAFNLEFHFWTLFLRLGTPRGVQIPETRSHVVPNNCRYSLHDVWNAEVTPTLLEILCNPGAHISFFLFTDAVT